MEVLYLLLVLLVVTRAGGEIALRLGQPDLVGNLIGGVLIGVMAHQWAGLFPMLSALPENKGFQGIVDLGVFFLMLMAGLEMHPKELAEASRSAFAIALGGLLLPLAAGWGLGWIFIPESEWKAAHVMLLATCMAITAIPVAVKVLMDLGELKTKAGNIIVSAAIFDDVFGLVLLAVLTSLLRTGEYPTIAGIARILANVIVFFGICSGMGLYVLPLLAKLLRRLWIEEYEFSMFLAVGLGMAILAELLGLHFILGAFLAGLFYTNRAVPQKTFEQVRDKVNAVTTGFLGPVFFASIGYHLDLSALMVIPGFVILLIVLAMLSKIVGAGVVARWNGLQRKDALEVGVAMSGRGAVEIIIAGIALKAGLFDKPDPTPPIVEHLFSAVVLMAIATTLLMPIGLRMILRRSVRACA